jgi:hypothetical protein
MFPPRAESVDSFSHQPANEPSDREWRNSAFGRLQEDGASSKDNIRRRILLIAAERGLSHAEIKPALTCHTLKVVTFMERHHISADWLLTGDLQGLAAQAKVTS